MVAGNDDFNPWNKKMHKLVILIEASPNWQTGEDLWPEFLRHAESMPGLRRETTSRVDRNLFGSHYVLAHELFFDSLKEAEQAMASAEGRLAGSLLQKMTGGKMTLFFADHKEDALENILKYRKPEEKSAPV
jgi:hypothetical protein